MSATTTDTERTTLERLREDFQAKGYEFVTAPRGEQLPDFLGAYRPDALAIGPQRLDKVIIEVKTTQPQPSKIPLSDLDHNMASERGWRYLLVYAGQDPSEIQELSRANRSQIDLAVKEARGLADAGHQRAAFMQGWSILEALARRLDREDIRISLRPLSPTQVVERLAMDGQITDQEARRLRALSSVRNALVHGDLNVAVSRDDLGYLMERLETINAQVTH